MKFQGLMGLLLMPIAALAGVQALSPAERAEIQHFRDQQAAVLQGPQSALGMVSLEKLPQGDTTIGSAPGSRIQLDHVSPRLGVIRLHGEQIEFLPPASGFPSDVKRLATSSGEDRPTEVATRHTTLKEKTDPLGVAERGALLLKEKTDPLGREGSAGEPATKRWDSAVVL